MRKLVAYKFPDEVLSALEEERKRTGKSKTAILEDALLMRRQFGDEAEAAVRQLAEAHQLPVRRVLEICVLKAVKAGGKLPFNNLVAA